RAPGPMALGDGTQALAQGEAAVGPACHDHASLGQLDPRHDELASREIESRVARRNCLQREDRVAAARAEGQRGDLSANALQPERRLATPVGEAVASSEIDASLWLAKTELVPDEGPGGGKLQPPHFQVARGGGLGEG